MGERDPQMGTCDMEEYVQVHDNLNKSSGGSLN